MKRNFDTIVLGLGGIGAGALYWLAKRLEGEVLGLEQHSLGHDRGGSQDHSRIIRYSYHHPIYVRLAERAYQAWQTLEADTGEQLVYRCGGLDLCPTGGALPADDYTESLEACDIAFERLEAAEIRSRWPAFVIPDSVEGLFQVDGGLVAAAQATAAHLRMARSAGAVIRENAPVTSVRTAGGEVQVVAGDAVYNARHLVVAAGAWSNDVLSYLGLRLPLTVTREQVVYYASPNLDLFSRDRLPVWIWMDEPCFYGFPVFGEPAVKVAQDVGGYETTATTRNFEPDPAGLARIRSWCEAYLPQAVGPLHSVKTCLYTLTPDRDFIVDSVPGHPEVVVAVGAGHAFKFASALGQILSELVVDGATDADLSAFTIDRPILQETNPPMNFSV